MLAVVSLFGAGGWALAAVAKKRPATQKKTSSSKKKKKGKKTDAQTWRNRQLQPTAERYKQIQQALAEKGYLKTTPNGVWDQESVEALKRFQNEQKLQATGKIDSLSLIALGLGPKHDAKSAQP